MIYNTNKIIIKNSSYNCFGRCWLYSETLTRATKIVLLVAVSIEGYTCSYRILEMWTKKQASEKLQAWPVTHCHSTCS